MEFHKPRKPLMILKADASDVPAEAGALAEMVGNVGGSVWPKTI